MSPVQQGHLLTTLTGQRLSKYLTLMGGDNHQALRLYVINSQLSAALLTDLHYTEVALRNKFEASLAAKFGPNWFNDPAFRAIISSTPKTVAKLNMAIREVQRRMKGAPPAPGKVVCELTFGFWHNLTVPKWEHTLWTPCLSKSFASGKAPSRGTFNKDLEDLRFLRNRVAHHEPVLHMDIHRRMTLNQTIAKQLCPSTALLLQATSEVDVHLKTLKKFLKHRK